MSKESVNAFLFAIVVIIALVLALIAVFCGGEMMKLSGLGIFCSISCFFGISVLCLLLFYTIPKYLKKEETEETEEISNLIFTEKSIEDLKLENNTIFLLHENSGSVPKDCTNVIVLKDNLTESDFSSKKENSNIYITQPNTKISLALIKTEDSVLKNTKIYLCRNSSVIFNNDSSQSKTLTDG